MLELARELEVTDIFYVMDRGSLTKINLTYAKKENLSFLVAVPKSQKIFQECLQDVSPDLRQSQYHIKGTSCYGTKKSVKIDGEIFTLYIYLNTKSASEEESMLYTHIDKLEEELEAKMKGASLARYNKYYDVKKGKEIEVQSFERNHEKITQAIRLAGMICLLSNEDKMTEEDALCIYSRRDIIEKAFDSIKNELDSDRFLTHTEETTQGKSFASFLALILWSDLMNQARQNKTVGEKTLERLLEVMKKVKRVEYKDSCSLLEPLTKKQKEILAAFQIDQDEFIHRILSTKV